MMYYSGNFDCPGRIDTPSRLGGDFLPWLRGTGSDLSSKKSNVAVICLAISLMSLASLMLLKPTYSVEFCLIHTMFSTN